jgi:hypothetical protein
VVGPWAGSVSQSPVEAGQILRGGVGHTGLGAQAIAEQRPGGADRIAHVVAVQHVGQNGDDLHASSSDNSTPAHGPGPWVAPIRCLFGAHQARPSAGTATPAPAW